MTAHDTALGRAIEQWLKLSKEERDIAWKEHDSPLGSPREWFINLLVNATGQEIQELIRKGIRRNTH